MGMTGGGYVVVRKDGHHRADKDGFVYEHVLVAEEKIKRELMPEEFEKAQRKLARKRCTKKNGTRKVI